ncbi:MAG: c-type cytochrome [Sulfuricella sp.]|nr:c-type cytochrome [Sulfuricella sp.]
MRNLLVVISAVALLLTNAAYAASADSGKTSYASNCASCHGVPGSPWNVGAQGIQSAIQGNRGGMARLSALTAAELQDIAAYLANPTATAVASGTPPSAATPPDTSGGTGTATTGTTPAATVTGGTSGGDDDERIFEWSGSQLYGSRTPSQDIGGFHATYYPQANVYLGTKDGQLYFYDVSRPGDGILPLGTTGEWSKKVASSGTTGSAGKEHGSGQHENNENHGGRDD